MESNIEHIKKELDDLKREWDEFFRSYKVMEREFTELKRELGVSKGREMGEQIDNIENKLDQKADNIIEMMRDMDEFRRLLENNDRNVQEIMKALSVIYKHVDELEGELIEDNET